ncbi:MAG: adenylyltransferase/cytidyltransferase family protein, partial [Candidatus Gastranaerophilales bacterium]|nr:adenylyltransferase/cytidyltransferase family protein [Candidatus Gastranaerophilales bacterium]
MKIAVYPGSFDPITLGHLDVLNDGAKLFDKVIITVSNNISKNTLLTVEERKELIRQSITGMTNVEVDS